MIYISLRAPIQSMQDDFTSLSLGCFAVKPKKKVNDQVLSFLYKEESKENVERRFDVYRHSLGYLDASVKDIWDTFNQKSMTHFVTFVSESLASAEKLKIDTLTIKVGSNYQELLPLYYLAGTELERSLNVKTVQMNCSPGSDINTVLKGIFNQLLSSDKDTEKILLKTLSMKNLFNYLYHEVKSEGLVLFIPQFDSLLPATTDKLIHLCSPAISLDFKVFFVLGLATGNELSSEWISSSSLSLLEVTTFDIPSSTSLLEQALTCSLIDPKLPFKLTFRTFETLLSRFSFSNYGIHDVLKTCKVALLNHCLNQPLYSLLHMDANNGGYDIDFSCMGEDTAALVLQLPSVQKYVEKIVISDKELACDLLNGHPGAIKTLFYKCKEKYEILMDSFWIIHTLIKNLPGNNLVSRPLELYSLFLNGSINEVKEISIAFKCVMLLSPENFLQRLESAYSKFEEFKECPKKVELLGKVLESQISEMRVILCETVDNEKNLKNSQLKSLQSSFMSRIENYLSTLTAPGSWPMNELIWYSDHVALQNTLVGKCRTALHRGLSEPDLYLQTQPGTGKPAICQLYELFNEHGKLISLHDWIQSFSSVKGKKSVSSETHAQFIKAVSELHFMGYLKPTKRKTDHVAKLSLLGY